jgi:5-methylcytosine-specific restriction endonuclease McrA
MSRTARVCTFAGCPEIVIGDSWCTTHKPKPWANSTRAQQRPPGWAKIRAHVLRRDHDTCHYCGGVANEVDHVIPVSRGGGHRTSNLVAACKACNAKKNVAERRSP